MEIRVLDHNCLKMSLVSSAIGLAAGKAILFLTPKYIKQLKSNMS